MELSNKSAEPIMGAGENALNQTTSSPESPAAEAVTTDIEVAVEPVTEVASTPSDGDLPETASDNSMATPQTPQLTKAEVLARIKEIAEMPDSEINSDEVNRLKQQFYSLHNDWLHTLRTSFIEDGGDATQFVPPVDPDEEEFKTTLNTVREKKAAYRSLLEAEMLRNLQRKEAIITEIEEIAADTDNVGRLYSRVKELVAEFKTVGEVPETSTTDIWKRQQAAVEKFYDQWKVNKELRDYDFKKNLTEKQQIIADAEALAAEEDVILAFQKLKALHEKWRETGPVAKDVRDEMWNRFREASSEVNKRHQAFFEERKKRELENENAKTALCEDIESINTAELKTYSAWNQASARIIKAQEEWKKLGFASRKTNNALFTRFRAACDAFFEAKAAFFSYMKEELAKNLRHKTALCEEAESLKDSTDWKATSDRLIELQKEWKTIGAVPKKHSDALWQRFLAACNAFFDLKKRTTSDTRRTEQANLQVKRGIITRLTALNDPADTTPRDEALNILQEQRQLWQSTGHVPFREKDKLHDAYREIVRQLYAKLDVHDNRGRAAKFEAAINETTDQNKLARERERLLRAYENRKNELATYENNLGFFNAKSKSGNSMLRELQGKIQHLKNDIADLEKKIELIDSRI